jgi:hypothetical protein
MARLVPATHAVGSLAANMQSHGLRRFAGWKPAFHGFADFLGLSGYVG